MEQTLGKRIVQHRKRLGLTQDRLAELLGVTAQAVSKWENDQSCPDITMLPKLAEVFGTTTDQLLGMEPQPTVHEAEIVNEMERDEDENEGFHVHNGNWEFKYDSGRKGGIGIALLILMVGGLLLAGELLEWNVSFWGVLWPSAILVFGLMGLVPKFPVSRILCTLAGAYFLADELGILPGKLDGDLVFPALLVILGLSLLIDALRSRKKPRFRITHNGGEQAKFSSNCTTDGEFFTCNTSFGEDNRVVSLPRLSGGDVTVSFGELTVDLSGCEELGDNCRIDASCSFGELCIRVPRRWRVELTRSASFASVDVSGSPAPDATGIIYMDCNASFGEIAIRYI